MKFILKIRKLSITGLMVLALGACGEGGVDGSGGTDPVLSGDLQMFQACFALAATGDCSAMDFNGDGFINYADLSLMKSATRYDLNQDGYVDISDSDDNQDRNKLNACMGATTEDCSDADFNGDKAVDDVDVALFQTASKFDLDNDELVDLRDIPNIVVEYSEDLEILLGCLYQMPAGDCESSDLNGDQIIDFGDTDAFVEAARFDLNGDGIIDFNNDNTDGLVDDYTNEDLKIFKACFFVYTAEVEECVIADFSGDGVVNVTDLALFKSAQKFDLNQDGFVDSRTIVESQDIIFIKVCFLRAAEDDCARADFNLDDVINFADLGEFKASGRFDLNNDGVVDLYGTDNNTDLDFISSCFLQTSEKCMAADFNEDGEVNFGDLALFKSAIQYDLNQDGFVDFRVNDALASQDQAVVKSCAFKVPEGDCAKVDFNGDGVINAEDLVEFRASGRFDLNGDAIVDLNNTDNNADLAILKNCFALSTVDFPECVIADFNGDEFINAADLALFKSATKYDLNNDGFVDLRPPAPAP